MQKSKTFLKEDFILKFGLLAFFAACFIAFVSFYYFNHQPRPFSITRRSHDVSHFHNLDDESAKYTVPQDGWMTSVAFNISGIDKENIHHLSLVRQRGENSYDDVGDLVFSLGKEGLMNLRLPLGYGYPVNKGDKFLFISHLYIPKGVDVNNVRTTVTMNFVPKTFYRKLKTAYAYRLDVLCARCIDPTYYIQPNSKDVRELDKKIVIDHDQDLIIYGGHLHELGEKIDLLVNDKVIHSFVPNYQNGKLTFVPPSHQRVSLKKGDVLNIKVYYNNSSEKMIDAMGIVMLYTVDI